MVGVVDTFDGTGMGTVEKTAAMSGRVVSWLLCKVTNFSLTRSLNVSGLMILSWLWSNLKCKKGNISTTNYKESTPRLI